MKYEVSDLIRAYQAAEKRGPKAAAAFRAKLNAASRRYLHGGETIEAAMFDVIEDMDASPRKKTN